MGVRLKKLLLGDQYLMPFLVSITSLIIHHIIAPNCWWVVWVPLRVRKVITLVGD